MAATRATLELFESCALPYLSYLKPNTCIEQTRILIDCLAHFGVAAEPLATKLHLVCPSNGFQYFISGDPRDHRKAHSISAGFRSRLNREGETLGYHTVALVERCILADLTLHQCSVPEFEFHLKQSLVQIPFGAPLAADQLPDIRLEGVSDNDVPFTLRYIGVADHDWAATPAWEPSHLVELIALICRDMCTTLNDGIDVQ